MTTNNGTVDLTSLIRNAMVAKTAARKPAPPKADPVADALAGLPQDVRNMVMAAMAGAKKEEKQPEKVIVETGFYKDARTITLQRGKGKPFTFGSYKAAMILEAIDQIRDFVKDETK